MWVELARNEDDEAIVTLARGAHLQVDPSAERTRSQSRLFVARSDAVPAGPHGFILGWLVADELEVLDVCVATDKRRGGIGSMLLVHLLQSARSEGARTAFLEVRRSNLSAQRLYQAQGFSQAGERAGYYSDGEDALLFRCCLTEPC